jgi:hypothetical protein
MLSDRSLSQVSDITRDKQQTIEQQFNILLLSALVCFNTFGASAASLLLPFSFINHHSITHIYLSHIHERVCVSMYYIQLRSLNLSICIIL